MATTALDTANAQHAGLLTVSIRRKFVPRLINTLRFAPYAADGTISPRSGAKVIRFNLQSDIVVSTTALNAPDEGDPGTGITTLTIAAVETTVSEYGRFAKVSSLADAVWTSSARDELADIFAHNGAKVIDTLLRTSANTTTNYLCAGFGTAPFMGSQGTSTGFTSLSTAWTHDVAAIEGFFNRNDATGFSSIGGSFALIVHGHQEAQMKSDVSASRLAWSNILQSTAEGQRNIRQGYVGTILNVAVMRSNNLVTTVGPLAGAQTTATAIKAFALADHGIGKTSIGPSGKGFDIIIKESGPQDTSNPLNMYGTIGWKAQFGHCLISSTRVLAYYSATGVTGAL